MSMSTSAVGIRPKDEKWDAMMAVWNSCKKAGIEPPEDVRDFFQMDEFGLDEPDESGMRIGIDDACADYQGNMEEGIDVDIRKLPKDVFIVRFSNSY